jgi:hypothetical protein
MFLTFGNLIVNKKYSINPYKTSHFLDCEQTLREEQCMFKSVYTMMPLIQDHYPFISNGGRLKHRGE